MRSVLKPATALLSAADLAVHPAARRAFEAWLCAWPALRAGASSPARVVVATWLGQEPRAVATFDAYARVLAGSMEAIALVQPMSEAEIREAAWAEVEALLAAAGLAPAIVVQLRERARRDAPEECEAELSPALRRKLARQSTPQPAPRPFARAIAGYRANRP